MNDTSNPESNIVPVVFDQRREIERNLPNPAKVDGMLKGLAGYPPRSYRECYYYLTHKGVLMIVRSWKNAELWDLFLENMLIEEGYYSAEAAADHANRHDFGSDVRGIPVKGLHISADLQRWTNHKVWC